MVRECRRHLVRVTESLIGGTSNRKSPVLGGLPDAVYLSEPDGLKVRIIEADLLVADTGSQTGDHYRLIITLLDHRRYPAAELIGQSLTLRRRWRPAPDCSGPCHRGREPLARSPSLSR